MKKTTFEQAALCLQRCLFSLTLLTWTLLSPAGADQGNRETPSPPPPPNVASGQTGPSQGSRASKGKAPSLARLKPERAHGAAPSRAVPAPNGPPRNRGLAPSRNAQKDTVFGVPLTAIDVPPGYAKRTLRVHGDHSGKPRWIEIEDGEERDRARRATASAVSAPKKESRAGWVVPVGEISPESTVNAQWPIASGAAAVDASREAVSFPLPGALGKHFTIRYSSDGEHWKTLGTFAAGVFVDQQKGRARVPGFYHILAVEVE